MYIVVGGGRWRCSRLSPVCPRDLPHQLAIQEYIHIIYSTCRSTMMPVHSHPPLRDLIIVAVVKLTSHWVHGQWVDPVSLKSCIHHINGWKAPVFYHIWYNAAACDRLRTYFCARWVLPEIIPTPARVCDKQSDRHFLRGPSLNWLVFPLCSNPI